MSDTPAYFVNRLRECVREYRKQLNDTRSDEDAAHFFNPTLKRFLEIYKPEVEVMASMNFEKPFMSWVKNYLFSEKNNDRSKR